MNAHLEWLDRNGACEESKAWVKENNIKSLEQAWKKCHRSDWMMWLARKSRAVASDTLVLLACEFAERSLVFATPETELASIWAIDSARRLLAGEADLDEVQAAYYAASAAYYAASAAHYAASYAYYADAAYYAYYADAAYYAANAANAANAASESREKELKAQAGIVRRHIRFSDLKLEVK